MNVRAEVTKEGALRGASAVDDELEVGFDKDFERRWARTESISHGIMAVVVLAALSGLLGHGPLSHKTIWTPDGRLAVDFEPLARFGTATQVTLHLPSEPGSLDRVPIVLSSSIAEPMGLQQIIPAPVESQPAGRELAYEFNIAPSSNSGLVRLALKPAVVGRVNLYAKVGTDTVSWTQWVLP
jgi:hypothetical protein